jgi:hypothetical protein
MTTPLVLSDFGVEDLSDLDDLNNEYIDAPPMYKVEVDLRGMGDSCMTLDALEKTALSHTFSLEDRFLAFKSMYQSPYVNKNQRCISVLLHVLEDETIPRESRFSWLTQLKVASDSLDVCLYGYVFWFYTYDDPLLYKLLSAQFMLSHPVSDYPFIKTHIKFSQQYLYQLSKKDTISVQLRSEAADLLIRLGTPNYRKAAEEVIESLGQSYVAKRDRTLYTNSQNVHLIDMESVKGVITWLTSEPLLIQLDHIYTWCQSTKDDMAIKSFQRIMMDTGIYYGTSMTDIFRHVFQRIQASEHRIELEQRLLEELREMNGWCSSGHIVRLVNVLHGFDEKANITVPIKEEIRAAVYSRLSYNMKTCSKELQDELIMSFSQEDKTLLIELEQKTDTSESKLTVNKPSS